MTKPKNLYATDGLCHNSEAGQYSDECRRPATWLGRTADNFTMGFCDHCKANGYEAIEIVHWEPLDGDDRLGDPEHDRNAPRPSRENMDWGN